MTPPPRKKGLIFFSGFLAFAETLGGELLPFSFKRLEYHAAWLEDLLQFSNNFDAPIH